MKELFIVAHPDDAEVMLGYAIAQSTDPYVVVITDGEGSTVDQIGDDFVKSGKRRQESMAGLSKLGVPEDHQLYFAMPDGGLPEAVDEIARRLQDAVGNAGIERIVTTGPEGYDGHPDHIAAHQAAISFCMARRRAGHEVSLFALDANQAGEVRVTGDQAQKIAAISAHVSQNVTDDITRWGNVDAYTPLITDAETYNDHKL